MARPACLDCPTLSVCQDEGLCAESGGQVHRADGRPPLVAGRHWAVYVNPSDFPGQHVLRVWMWLYGGQVIPETEPRAVGTLEEVRAAVPSGLVCVGRMPRDDPAILEVWI